MDNTNLSRICRIDGAGRARVFWPRVVVVLATLSIALSNAVGQELATAKKSHVMWRVDADSSTVFLLGSVHALPSSVYPLDSIIEATFDSCSRLALELDLGANARQSMQLSLMSRGMYSGKSVLKENVSPETYDLLTSRLESQGMDVRLFSRFKPWVIGMFVVAFSMKEAGLEAEHGLDLHFQRRAEQRKVDVVGLETVDDQIAVFDSMSPSAQEEFLRQQLLGDTSAIVALRQVVDAWRAADLPALESLLTATRESPELYERMVIRRNRNWVTRIEQFLAERRRTMVVVGALHLLGRDGLVELLRARGYSVSQM